MNDTITAIQNNETYKQILSDSFGGIMYNVANRGKYDTAQLLLLWNTVPSQEREAVGGIMRGAFNFLTEEN